MFALHETTQRRVCRVSFLALCVVPTLLTLAGVAYCNRPWRQADWQQTLGQRLHVRAELGDIVRPRPGVTVLSNLRLADLRTNQALGSMGTLSFQRQNSRLILNADRLEIQAEQLPAFVTSFATWLANSDPVPFDLRADQLTITNASLQTVQLNSLSISSDTSDPLNEQYRLTALSESGEKIQLTLESIDDQLSCTIDTRRVALPAWLIGKLVPGVAGCGDAKFTGVISADLEQHHARGKLKGLLNQVDLQQWTGDTSLHQLQGLAQIEIDQLVWSEESLDVVVGRFVAQQGAVSNSLLTAMQELFACQPATDAQWLASMEPDAQIAFEQLAVSFRMSSAGITLNGECADGALLVSNSRPLFYGPPTNSVFAIAQFVRLFHRPQQGWLPDTQSAHQMSRELPLPAGENATQR